MTLPVFAVAGATLRDLARFVLRHPFAVVAATACVVPIEYRLALAELSGRDASSLRSFAVSWALTAAVQIVWLPLLLLGIREVVSGQKLRLPVGTPSAATCRYGVYNLALLSVSLAVFADGLKSDGLESVAAGVAKLLLAMGLAWFALRATLAFSALALGRQDLGLAQSVARTARLTWRLLAIFVLPVAAIMASIFMLMVAMTAFLDVADGDAYLYPIVFLGVAGQLAVLAPAIAGAHVYRLLDGSVPQNGRY